MWGFLERYFAGNFMPHGHCYLWTPWMVWTQVTANALIGLAYLSISTTLTYLATRRIKLPFSWVYVAFGVFILACGLTHFLDVATVWHPIYWVDASVRVVTAVASVGTALLLFPLLPKIVTLSQVSEVAAERGRQLEAAVADLGQALQETTRYRLLVDSVKDATIMLDSAGRVNSWNGGAERMMGYAAAEIVDRHISLFRPPEESATSDDEILRSAARDGVFEDEQWRARKDGTRFWAGLSVTAMRDSSGLIVGFAKVVRDLTPRMKAEAELRQLAAENARLAEQARVQEFQERFLAILGHDLRNPLAAIAMGTTLLQNRANDEASARILRRMDSSGQRMSRMIEQILDLTRARLAGGLVMHAAPVNLLELLGAIVDEARIAHPTRTIELTCSAVTGTWDRDRLEQVFSNLIGNALQYGTADGSVIVSSVLTAETAAVTIHNDGPAIAASLQKELFNPFRRGDRDSNTAQTSGLGLGLYISREIVMAHGGGVHVRSTPSSGTDFTVELPLRRPRLTSDETS